MAVPSEKAKRAQGQKEKAREAVRLGVDPEGPGDLTLDKKLALKERGPSWERWAWRGEPVTRNQVIELACQEVAGGAKLSRLLKGVGLPSIHVFMGWVNNNPAWKTALREAEEIRATVWADDAMERAEGSGAGRWVDMQDGSRKFIVPAQVEQKGDELFVKTAMWMAERTHRAKFGQDVPLADLKDELRQMSEGALMDRLVAALVNSPAVLEKLAPQLKTIIPEEKLAELQEKALEAHQAGSIPGEVVP